MTCPFVLLRGICFLFFSFPALKELCFPDWSLSLPQFQPSIVFIYLGFTLSYQHKHSACSYKIQEVPWSGENINITLQSWRLRPLFYKGPGLLRKNTASFNKCLGEKEHSFLKQCISSDAGFKGWFAHFFFFLINLELQLRPQFLEPGQDPSNARRVNGMYWCLMPFRSAELSH